MRIAKWGNSLAVRIPADVVKAMNLKPGDEVEIVAVKDRSAELEQKRARIETLEGLRHFLGKIPADFKFDRDEANSR